MKKWPGTLITFEGIDGSGKTSLINALDQQFRQLNKPVFITKQPGATLLGQEIRKLVHDKTIDRTATAELLLFAADRAQHINDIIIPALQKGSLVLSDRFADSAVAYQGYGRGLNIEMINYINNLVLQDVQPDLTVYLKIDSSLACNRITTRNEARTAFEQEKKEFFDRVTAGFDTLFKNRHNVIIIDGDQEITAIHKEVFQRINKYLHHYGN